MDGDFARLERLLTELLQLVVEDPGQVRVTTLVDDDACTYQVSVAPEDVGRIIGERGRTARAVRTILSVCGQRARKHFSLDIRGQKAGPDWEAQFESGTAIAPNE